MIQALPEQPGSLSIVDPAGKRHVVHVHALSQATASGPSTTYVTQRHGPGLFVRVPVEQVKAEMSRARKLRRAQKAAWASAQLPLNFGGSE